MSGRIDLPATVNGECVFCAIAHGRAEASVVHDDGELLGIADLRPVTTGHLLVIPRAHAVGLADLPPDVGGRMFQVGQRLAAALRRSGVRCAGVNLFLADGVAAGQEIFHAHLHVIPRHPGDGFRLSADWRVRPRAELDELAATVRAALNG
ncbi:HIT family protein [Streptoalloteichus hindustanus]|uniref:Diadenosine tetraphosphate (Ap4A) hydrolase n=1 Tax=Streptoalloteichus hindustanus TaxID=2017 RepID=A0A1M5GEH3_STRHI|nr:HIT family protein [Streptoalloteichus hindustanus]SHG02145.1 Diadenosine tetraphosphate (Ap4A) hydrolase [Streptoalloteichus hindustanus]